MMKWILKVIGSWKDIHPVYNSKIRRIGSENHKQPDHKGEPVLIAFYKIESFNL